ncbi:MAG: hypothetical protein J5786_06670 [Clostridiales bacterium]|nr:hypothetical protein [Clostridiales bacterium]
MTQYIKTYLSYIESFIKNRLETASDEEIEKVLSEFETKIAYFQHERLIHLIVTMFFALFTLMEFALIFMIRDAWDLIISAVFLMAVILLCVLIGYVCHYYFLENSVQKMYRLRDKIIEKKAK